MKKLAFAALLLAACSLSSPGGVQVRPEHDGYIVSSETQPVTVRYTVTNTGDSPVGVATCGDRLSVQIQKKSNGLWNTLTPPTASCLAALSLRTIESGRSVTDSVTVQGTGTWRVLVPWSGAQGESGTAASSSFETGFARL